MRNACHPESPFRQRICQAHHYAGLFDKRLPVSFSLSVFIVTLIPLCRFPSVGGKQKLTSDWIHLIQ
jgi:hypothetical protein